MTDSPLFTPVERFLRYLGVERQLSPITLLNYRRQLKTLIALADSAGLKSWQQCDAAQVRSLAVRSRRQGLGPASRKHRAIYQKISTSTTLTDCWISILTIRWRYATGRCWK